MDDLELAMCRRLFIRYKQSLGIKPSIDIATRIQALPQELQDLILHFKLLTMLPPEMKLYFDGMLYTVQDPGCERRVDFTAADSEERDRLMSKYGWRFRYNTYNIQGGLQSHQGPVPVDRVVFVDLSYKPSIALQINRETRATMAKILYGNTMFLMKTTTAQYPGGENVGCLPGVFPAKLFDQGCWYRYDTHWRDFMESLSMEHRQMARVIWSF